MEATWPRLGQEARELSWNGNALPSFAQLQGLMKTPICLAD